MRISINVTNYSWPGRLGQELTEVARRAEDAGVDTLWVNDHLIQADPTAGPGQNDMLEAYTTLGFVAAKTERIRLGTMVSAVTFRPPGLLVKAVTTLDVLSGGRAWLGIGAGYQQAEATAMGLPLPPVGERFEQLADTVRLARQMWAADESPFQGKQIRLERPHPYPVPDSRPRILIGGTGEKKTLRLVAQYADACNLFDVPGAVEPKLAVLRRHCAEVGRPFDEIEKTLSIRLAVGESSDSFVRRCAAAEELGIDHVIVITPGYWTVEALNTLSRIA